jgi:RNA polymerase primary sigma factor
VSSKNKIIKHLVELAQKYGYLTFNDIHKTFDEYEVDKNKVNDFVEMLTDMGIKIIESEEEKNLFKDIQTISEEVVQGEPLRIFINEINKYGSMDRSTEIAIAKRIRANEAELLSLVLSSPIALREINHWVELVKQKEMSPKELMRRGRKTRRSLKKMRRKLSSTVNSVNKLIKNLSMIQQRLNNKNLPLKLKIEYQTKFDHLKKKVVDKINSLKLNTEKVKRLIKKTQTVTDKVVQLIEEEKKYEHIFSTNYETIANLFKNLKHRKITPTQFKRITGYNVSAAQTLFINFQKVHMKLLQYKKELNMTDEEIIKLNKQIYEIKNQIEKDKMEIIQVNLGLAVTFAKKFAMLTGADVNDLMQEGATGLTKAVEKFEWRKGYKFSTYAHWWIRQAISRYMAEYTKTIRLPVHIRELVSKMIKVYKTFKQKSDGEITTKDYSRILKVPHKKIVDTLAVLPEPISADTPKGDDEDTTVQDFIPADEVELPLSLLLQEHKREVLKEVMDKFLDERERQILKMRYGFDGKEYTLEEVGRMFNITRERVRQIEAKAIRRLRSPEALKILREIYPVRD